VHGLLFLGKRSETRCDCMRTPLTMQTTAGSLTQETTLDVICSRRSRSTLSAVTCSPARLDTLNGGAT